MKRLKLLIAPAVMSGGYGAYNHKEGKEQNDTWMLQHIDDFYVQWMCAGISPKHWH